MTTSLILDTHMAILSTIFFAFAFLWLLLFCYHYTLGLFATGCMDRQYAEIVCERIHWDYVNFYMTFPEETRDDFLMAIEYLKYSGGFLALAGVCWLSTLHFLT